MAGIIFFIVSIIIVLTGIVFIIVAHARTKDYTGIIVVLTIISVGYVCYGWGAKTVHYRYSKAYFEPTKRIFSHLSSLVKMGNLKELQREVEYFDKELQDTHWADTTAFQDAVEKTLLSSDPKERNGVKP